MGEELKESDVPDNDAEVELFSDEHVKIVTLADHDLDDKDTSDARPSYTRAQSSFYNSAKEAYVERVSHVIVRRPKTILAGVLVALIGAVAGLAFSGFAISSETEYDWDVQDDKFTLRYAMIEDANDRADAQDVAERTDETFWFSFFYDSKSYGEPRKCDGPRGIFTARNVQAICETERELLARHYGKYCVAGDAGGCAPLEHSLAGFFYSVDIETLAASDCPLLDDATVDAVAQAMYSDEATYGALLDGGAFGQRGYACRGRSLYALASPLDGYTDVADGVKEGSQYRKMAKDMRRVNSNLQKEFNMKAGLLSSAFMEEARAGSPKMSVLWFSDFLADDEFEVILTTDFALAIFSFLFVWFWMRVHLGSCTVASLSMLQILISLPLSLFIYYVVFQISYFGAMQQLVIFIILGIGADDVFVYSDAWHQSEEGVLRTAGEARESWLRRRVVYAYTRALEAIFNTSFTTAVAFFATATSKIMPISTFGIFAAICILMNYGLVMVCTPAVWILCTDREDPAEDAEPKKKGCCASKCCVECPRPATKFFEGYLAVLSKRPVALACVLAALVAGAFFTFWASRLVPPSKPEQWFPDQHMFTRVQDLSDSGYAGQLAERYPDASLYWGLDRLKRPKWDPYTPDKHRGDVKFSSPPLALFEAEAQDQVLAGCEELRLAKGGSLVRPGTVVCFLEDFQAWHAATFDAGTYELGATTFNAHLSEFRESTTPSNDENPTASWEDIIGFVDGELRFVRVASRLNTLQDDSMDRKDKALRGMDDVVDRVDATPGSEALGDSLIQYSHAFAWYQTQLALVDGLLFGLSLAFPVAFVVLVGATQNIVLALYAIVTIGLIVSSVLGTCFVLGWNLGIKEAIAGVVVIGFSVDYTIHLGHMYDHARYEGISTRADKFAYAIRKMGETVLAGAVTTAGSCSFLLACQLTFFTAMGTLIILTVAFSLTYSLLFFMPLLRVAGPEGHTGNVCAYFYRARGLCIAKKK